MTIASDLLQRHIETLVADHAQWQTRGPALERFARVDVIVDADVGEMRSCGVRIEKREND